MKFCLLRLYLWIDLIGTNRIMAFFSRVLLDYLSISFDYLNTLSILPDGSNDLAVFISQSSLPMSYSILELSIIKISSDHWSSLAFCTIVNPIAVIIIPICPVIDPLPMFFAELEVALIDIFSILSLIDNLAFAMIFAIQKLPFICAIIFFYIFSYSMELVILKVALILISISKFNLSFSKFNASSPKTLVFIRGGYL